MVQGAATSRSIVRRRERRFKGTKATTTINNDYRRMTITSKE
jgi:hypothetical protein